MNKRYSSKKNCKKKIISTFNHELYRKGYFKLPCVQLLFNPRMLPFEKLTGMVTIRLPDELWVSVLKITFDI